ncbi:3-hydroxyacyl-CoA dehydrogenase NAD-binding domain-containing protein [Imbroritus primus]|uniref:3-hydroxyacyl-CoA dehydrogenase NAD-binding domain-containing protein n=1 Tax=Imbroritus primus TaxID=3058603 RepID=UPI003D160762
MMNETLRQRLQDGVLVLTLNQPPVNALGNTLRKALVQAVETAQADPQVRAIVLHGAGRGFSAGADITEFGQPREFPWVGDVCTIIENCDKPVIAALHGMALGGGLELALGAHYRIAARGTKLGLPEVQIGLIPGGGGTQRLPRLIGAAAALDLMLSGRHASVDEAKRIGLIDRIATQDDPLEEACAWASEILAQGGIVRRTRDAQALGDSAASLAAVEAARAGNARKARGLFAPFQILDAVKDAIEQPFEAGIQAERARFLQCVDSPQRAGLVHAFFAERRVRKAPETESSQPRPVATVGVIGGGTMGSGIAVALLDAGLQVIMVERDDASLQAGRQRVEKVYDRLIANGRMEVARKEAVLQRFTGATSYDAFAQADLVIEAVFEDMDVKKAVFGELDRICKPGAILATNTSYLDIDAIAASISRPQDVIGLHFFSPANIMKLLEIVVPAKVSADVVATGFALADKLRKVPVRAGICDGFIGNRILYVYREVASHMMEDGASPYEIDQALEEFGYAMGPFRTNDLTGGDIGYATRKRKAATRDPNARYVRIADQLCERNWLGQKTGRGWYRYPEGSRSGQHDPEVLALIDAERAERGIQPRTFSSEDILRRYMAAVINESANVLHDKIALRPLDIDVTLVHGYGFPRWRGGPMHYADTVGLDKVLADIRSFEKEDPLFWKPSPLLVELVERQASFASLNQLI